MPETFATLALICSVMWGEVKNVGTGLENMYARRAVAQVIMNRVEHPMFPDTVESVVAMGFTARGEVDRVCIWGLRQEMPIGDTSGYLYALSLSDVHRLGFGYGDRVYGSGIFQLHLYREGSGAW